MRLKPHDFLRTPFLLKKGMKKEEDLRDLTSFSHVSHGNNMGPWNEQSVRKKRAFILP
jgi:hypothetical protein